MSLSERFADMWRSGLIAKVLIGLGVAFAAAVAGVVIFVVSLMAGLPSARELENYEPPITSRVHAGDGKLVAEFASQHRVYVPYEEIPEKLVQAFISAEDKSFFEHGGIDVMGLVRGTLGNAIRGRKMAGGSTITQQVVKNMLVGDERSAVRKIKEAIVAQRMEKIYSKEQILEFYMNEIYLGGRSYGVGAAALNYFGKSLKDLTVAECAMLAALPQRPSDVNPYNKPKAAQARRDWVLSRMATNGYLTEEEAKKAQADPLVTVERLSAEENRASAYFVEEVRREILRLGKEGKLSGFETESAAKKGFYEGGLSIRSTLDTTMQVAAERSLRAGLETYDRRHGWRGPLKSIDAGAGWPEALKEVETPKGAGEDWTLAVVLSAGEKVQLGLADGSKGVLAPEDAKWAKTFKQASGKAYGVTKGDVLLVSRQPAPDVSQQTIKEYDAPRKVVASTPWRLRQIPLVQGALVALDPHTGRVFAMVGGYSTAVSQFNRAVQARRQPGSSFKPFVYAAALDRGKTPASLVLDAPFVLCLPNQPCYKPSNYSEQFYGESTLRLGIEKSRNAMTVRLAQDMGLEVMSEYGEKFGIYGRNPWGYDDKVMERLPPYHSMSLGAGETTPMRIAAAYAMLVNGGKRISPTLLDRIQDRYGKTVYRRDERVCGTCNEEWSSEAAPPTFEDEREQVIDPITAYQMVSMLEGAVQRGTGTAIRAVGKPLAAKTGTTNDFMDAWTVGFSPDLVLAVWIGHDTPKTLGEGESGGRNGAPIFRDFMMRALENAPAQPFRIPSGVRLVEIDADTGCLPSESTRVIIPEAFKPGTEPTERCEGESDGVGFEQTLAGDEIGLAATATGTLATAETGELPVDPAQGQPEPDLTLRDGIF